MLDVRAKEQIDYFLILSVSHVLIANVWLLTKMQITFIANHSKKKILLRTVLWLSH